ncbi:MAG: hypothetical protein FJ298_02725 [Planctomycetes bacterium]|nr:hypothetical protein [Planctomycetota bacterium]
MSLTMHLRVAACALVLAGPSSAASPSLAHGGSAQWRGPQGDAPPPRSPSGNAPSVGMPARWNDVVLSGSELVAVSADRSAPLALRIVAARAHGDAFRYDFEYWGLEPGAHDLRTLLQRRDGSSCAELPELRVEIQSVLATHGAALPNAPRPSELPSLGGYDTLLVTGAVVWVAGLVALLVAGRRRRAAELASAPRVRSLAERLQPLVERALRGELAREERAQLELSLVALWRRRLGLEAARPADVLVQLRAHPEAGPLLCKLEEWLHRPDARGAAEIPALLAPYRGLREDELDAPGGVR